MRGCEKLHPCAVKIFGAWYHAMFNPCLCEGVAIAIAILTLGSLQRFSGIGFLSSPRILIIKTQ
jgi:hypothetical protein